MNAAEWLRLAKEHGATIRIDGDRLKLSGDKPLPPEIMDGLKTHKTEIIELVRIEERRQKALSLFDRNPTASRVYLTDTESDPDHVIVTIGLKTGETCELFIPRAAYDPFLFLECITSFETGVMQ